MWLSAHLQGLAAQAWAKPGLGENSYDARKYGIILCFEGRLASPEVGTLAR